MITLNCKADQTTAAKRRLSIDVVENPFVECLSGSGAILTHSSNAVIGENFMPLLPSAEVTLMLQPEISTCDENMRAMTPQQ